MAKGTRELADHMQDMRDLNEALTFWSMQLGRPHWVVTSDVLNTDRSYYGLRDAGTGAWNGGAVEKTATMWRLTTPDSVTFRGKNLDQLIIRFL